MLELNQEEFESLRNVEIEILNEVSRICKKYKLKYSLTGGTLLGAIRHKGFIPWDDDIDIVMPYKDYILFLEYANKEMNSNFFISNIYTDKYFGYLPISKVMANNTDLVELPARFCKAKSGIFIDVFPLYNTSDIKLIRKIDFWFVQRLSKSLRCRNGYIYSGTKIHKIIYKIRHYIYKLIPLFAYKFLFSFIVNKNKNNNASEYLVSYGGVYGFDKETFPRKWFNQYIDLEFEGKIYSSMKEWEPYLKSHYGEYMKLPPIEKRIPHHYLAKYENNFKKI